MWIFENTTREKKKVTKWYKLSCFKYVHCLCTLKPPNPHDHSISTPNTWNIEYIYICIIYLCVYMYNIYINYSIYIYMCIIYICIIYIYVCIIYICKYIYISITIQSTIQGPHETWWNHPSHIPSENPSHLAPFADWSDPGSQQTTGLRGLSRGTPRTGIPERKRGILTLYKLM
jgi:hypothetical protein